MRLPGSVLGPFTLACGVDGVRNSLTGLAVEQCFPEWDTAAQWLHCYLDLGKRQTPHVGLNGGMFR